LSLSATASSAGTINNARLASSTTRKGAPSVPPTNNSSCSAPRLLLGSQSAFAVSVSFIPPDHPNFLLETWYYISEMHASFVRAHRQQREAALATIEFQDKFMDFAEHINEVVSAVGSDALEARFSHEANSTESMREAIAHLVDQFNIAQAEHKSLHDPEHVKDFNANIDAHDGKQISGRPATPPLAFDAPLT